MPLIADNTGAFITNPLAGSITYESDHYSGSQVCVMFGDTLIDNAISITFNVNQDKKPVYGYASQYYSFVASGKVLVQGLLTVAFKEAGYLFWPIRRFLQQQQSPGEWSSPKYSVDKNGLITRGYDVSKTDGTFRSAAQIAAQHRLMQANVEQMAAWSAESPMTNQQAYNTLWRELGSLPDDTFEDWAEVFEDSIWYGSDHKNPNARDQLFSKNLREDDELDEEAIYSHRRLDQYPAIDIWIVYGDMNAAANNHTVRKLLDVSFLGQSQTIEVSGEPIFEQYSFICRNLV